MVRLKKGVNAVGTLPLTMAYDAPDDAMPISIFAWPNGEVTLQTAPYEIRGLVYGDIKWRASLNDFNTSLRRYSWTDLRNTDIGGAIVGRLREGDCGTDQLLGLVVAFSPRMLLWTPLADMLEVIQTAK